MKSIVFSFFFVFLSGCALSQCSPRFQDLKTQYPHVIYHGPKQPFDVVIRKAPPPTWVTLNQVSRAAVGAILVSEDWAFYSHPGYDEKQIREVIETAIEKKKITRGASTITQQVVRNVYLTQNRSIIRKARELWMATKIEKVLGKKKILEIYLNIAEWGEGIFGIERAAQHYFGKSAASLTAKEGAFLAMLLPSPKKYSISFRKRSLTPFARKIIRSILRKMVQGGFLGDFSSAWAAPLSFEYQPQSEPEQNDKDDAIEDETESDDAS